MSKIEADIKIQEWRWCIMVNVNSYLGNYGPNDYPEDLWIHAILSCIRGCRSVRVT